MDKNIAIGLVDTLADLTRRDWDVEQCREIILSFISSPDSEVSGQELLKQFDRIINSTSFSKDKAIQDSDLPCQSFTADQRIELAIAFYRALTNHANDLTDKLFTAWNAIGIQPDDAICLYLFLSFSQSQDSLQLPSSSVYSQNDFERWISSNRNRLILLYDDKNTINGQNIIVGEKRIGIGGAMLFAYFHKIGCYLVRYDGDRKMTIEDENLASNRYYCFKPGTTILLGTGEQIQYNDITQIRLIHSGVQPVKLIVQGIEFTFPGSSQGIKPFSTVEESGRVVGILGGSGVGKSTLLNLLSGKLVPHKGKVLINGYDVHNEPHKLMGVIGFVPQDDLLIENLTVYQNMLFNARLCFGNYSRKQVRELVDSTLKSLDLWEIRNLRVGNALDKVISGGQRKRLNIGLELLREPAVLFLDEPTSGLSSNDSVMVLGLLRNLADAGKLIVVNIHQPSERLFRMFDRLWVLDKGGYPVYVGNPTEAITYFRDKSVKVGHLVVSQAQKKRVNPEDILDIIEQRQVDRSGLYTINRKVSPEEWYRLYCESIQPKVFEVEGKTPLPQSKFQLPDVVKQLKVFSKRNLLAKLANRQYMLLNILEPIVLGLILSFFIKYSPGNEYIFAANRNIPAFIFMSVIVSLFLGLSVSAEEIIGDRRILERESFLSLSRFSYINSKVLYLFGLSALQMLLFVGVSVTIIGIKGLTLKYWLVLFSSACFANMLGLIISSVMKSVVAIYITIPLLLVPQILLSGTVVDFDNLNSSLTRRVYVPVIGDIMTSRWAYEALAVTQFMDNRYEKNIFDAEMQLSRAAFRASFLIPRLQVKLEECLRLDGLEEDRSTDISRHLRFIANEIEHLAQTDDVPQFELLEDLKKGQLYDQLAFELNGYLLYIKKLFQEQQRFATAKRDSVYVALKGKLGDEGVYRLKLNNHNNALAEWVLRSNEVTKYLETENRLIQKAEPIYMLPDHPFGRAHLYAPYKLFNGQYIKTIWFNIIAIWIFTIFLYTLLNLINNKKTGKVPVLWGFFKKVTR